ncbi:MAG: hypothetical protein Q8R67_12070 [Rhodoferax sp.]|nr:hypothetical protein [Rhodoferax sp.]MDP3652408.1 hypothetical protein [Rhodoferax sp.]
MGFNQTDADNINIALQHNLCCEAIFVGPHENHMLYRVELSPTLHSFTPATVLARYLEALHRGYGEGCTIWLDSKFQNLPAFIEEAFMRLIAFGLKAIVVQNGETSADGSSTLPASLISAVNKANAGGQLWNPVTKAFVYGVTTR